MATKSSSYQEDEGQISLQTSDAQQQLCPFLPGIPQTWPLDVQKLALSDGWKLVECFPEEKDLQSALA